MSNTLQWILIAVLSSVIILILVYNVAPSLFKFEFLSFVSQTPNLGNIFQPKDLTAASQYEGYELSYDGMVLEKDAGYDNIDQVLKANISIPDCRICPSSSCQPVDFNSDGTTDTYRCDSCGICNGISNPFRFKNCLGCNLTDETCILCTDTDKEYALCNKIKNECILSQYREENKKGCYLGEIPHNNGTSFDINTLINVLKSCRSESLMINMGNNFMKELCYFNSSSISYYDFNRNSDFYLDKKAYNENLAYDGTAIIACADEGKTELTPFREENEEWVENYRIYVAINTTHSEDYNIYVGNWGWSGGVCGSPATVMYKIGTITTDSNGFGSAEFDNYGDADAGGGKTWRDVVREYPTKNKMTGVEAAHTWSGKFGKIWLTFYANSPTNGEWTNELRYSNCNFDTDIEPYLKDRQWWVPNNKNLNSSWYMVSGNPNSSIKVFYDSSMPGGGNSLNRGNIKLQLGKLDVDFQKNCMFDIYVCSQDAFAEYEGENILDLNDFLKDFNPINVYNVSSFENKEIILYNYFESNLDKEYTVEEIKSAIKTGFRNWEQNLFLYLSSTTGFDWLKDNDGIYQGSWTDATRSLVYENDCWDNSLNTVMERLNKKLIIGNCQNDICKGKIKVRIAFKYIKPNNTMPERDFLYPTVTFCDTSNAPATPPNPCSSYTSDSDCMFAGCKWCPSITCTGEGGSSCTTNAKCIGESDSPDSCQYKQRGTPFWNCFIPFCSCPEQGFPGAWCVELGTRCDWWATCTTPTSQCY